MTTPRIILILDDEPERIRAMTTCLSNGAPGYGAVTFDNARDMIDWLRKHLEDACLICLDHDLGPNRSRDGNVFGHGAGATWLTTWQARGQSVRY